MKGNNAVANWWQRPWLLALVIWAGSVPLKLAAAHLMVWDMDIVAVIARVNAAWEQGMLPPVGTLASVGAYNLPMLVWLHLPARLLTSDPRAIMLLTLLAFNALSTIYVYRAGAVWFNPRAGLIAAALFTFSETGVASSYIPWAQLLLPGFCAMTLYHGWQWSATRSSGHLALTGMLAGVALMTHFSAIMLFPTLLLLALLLRARWSWQGLIGGSLVVGALAAPYLLFQAQHEFRDLRAFLTRTPYIDPAVLAEAEAYGWTGQPSDSPIIQTATPGTEVAPPPTATPDMPLSLPERLIGLLLRLPGYLTILLPNGLFTPDLAALNQLASLILLGGLALAGRAAVQAYRAAPEVNRWLRLLAVLRTAWGGRMLLLFGWMLVFALALISVRATPIAQPSYYMGLLAPQCLILGACLAQLAAQPRRRSARGVVIGLLLVIGLVTSERLYRVAQHDDTVFSGTNAWLYRNVAAAVDFIAADWGTRPGSPVIAYDFLPEMGNQWWILAWHTVDPLYRLGAAYDVLLAARHGLTNANSRADGRAEQPDYWVTYPPKLGGYAPEMYTIHRFGVILVLTRY